ncbi:MAG TPA: hypothetical protein VJZ31_02530 [Bacilli bacterium]|nr:hypothetical protein [Bacilli bacterium]
MIDKFEYVLSLNEVKEGLAEIKEYKLYHLVDKITLTIKGIKGDFINVINEAGDPQLFSLSHMYAKKVIKPDGHLFNAKYLGRFDNEFKHDSRKKITNFDELEATLRAYDFDGFYLITALDQLVESLKEGYIRANVYKKNPELDLEALYNSKTSSQDSEIHFKENINNFVRLHYRAKDDLMLAYYNALKRLNKAKVLIRFNFDLIKDDVNRVYPLPNCGLDLIYDQHFYQLKVSEATVAQYHFEKYDYVAMFSSYDNHSHSTMVRTAEVLVYDKLATTYIDRLIFINESERIEFLLLLNDKDKSYYTNLSIVDPHKFY